MKGQTITISNELGLPLKTINLEHLRRVMSLRLEEIFQLIEQDIAQAKLLDYLRSGVFICGGGARIPGILTLAERIFQMPASLGKANSISGIKSALDQPEFAALRDNYLPFENDIDVQDEWSRGGVKSCPDDDQACFDKLRMR